MLQVDAARRTRAAARRIEAGALNNGGSLERLAYDLGISTRQSAPGRPARIRRVARRVGPDPAVCCWPSNCSPSRICRDHPGRVRERVLRACADSMRFFCSHYRLTPSRMRRASITERCVSRLQSGSRWLTVLPLPGMFSCALSRRTCDGGSRIGLEQEAYGRNGSRRQSSRMAQGQADCSTKHAVGRAGDLARAGLAGGPRVLEEPFRLGREAGRIAGVPFGWIPGLLASSLTVRDCECRSYSTGSTMARGAPSWASVSPCVWPRLLGRPAGGPLRRADRDARAGPDPPGPEHAGTDWRIST